MTVRRRIRGVRNRAIRARARSARVVFGDRVGFVLFLAALIFSLSTWRIGVFITDNWTLANSFLAVADGQLHVDAIRYGPDHGRTPGMKVADGRRYAYNYGQQFASLPLLWLLWGVSAVADPAVAIVAAFGLLVLALFVQLGRVLDREVTFSYVGVGLSLAAVAANLAVAVEVRPYWFPFAALQLGTILAASLSAVVLYRLVGRMYGRRIGAVGGAVGALASPIPFWATIPKRHALTALLVLVTLYYFYRSRAEPSGRSGVQWHALAYVPVGLLAWVNSAEGLVLFGALLVSDALTVPRLGPARFAAVSAAFLASLFPFLLTNWLVMGNVLTPPRLAPVAPADAGVFLAVGEGDVAGAWGGFTAASTAVPPGPGLVTAGGTDSTLDAVVQWVAGMAKTARARLEHFYDLARQSREVASDGDRMYQIFVRRGYVEGVTGPDGQVAVSLSMLESMPLLGGLLAVPVAVARGLNSRIRGRTRWSVRTNPTVAVDLFVVCFVVMLLALYLKVLPIQVSWTVRYLHPLYPLGVYLLLRNPAVRDPIVSDASLLAVTYAGTVFVGGEVVALGLAVVKPTLGEAVQLHANLAVGLGGLLAVWAVVYTAAGDRLPVRMRRRVRRTGAVLVAFCCAATTVLVVLWAVAYYPHSQFAVPAVGEMARVFPSPS